MCASPGCTDPRSSPPGSCNSCAQVLKRTAWCRLTAHMKTSTNQPDIFKAPSSLAIRVASMPWVFSQQHPLDTAEFIREADKRGVRLNALALRELYRVALLVPFVTVTSRRVR